MKKISSKIHLSSYLLLREKSGREVGTEYQRILQTIETISPKKSALETWKAQVAELHKQRRLLLDELSSYRAEQTAKFEKTIKKLNINPAIKYIAN